MLPDDRFLKQNKDFWANVRTLSQKLGYTQRGTGQVKVPSLSDCLGAMADLALRTDHIADEAGSPTSLGKTLLAYFEYRARILNTHVEGQLMDVAEARELFMGLRDELRPTCPLKCGRSYLCRIIDMLHMRYLDEVLFGREVVSRLPELVPQWVALAQERTETAPGT